jgi:nicotinamidase-related amidase
MAKKYFTEKETSFLVIIDVQKNLYAHVLEKENLLKNLVKLVKVARLLEIPIILTEQKKLGETIKPLKTLLRKSYSPIKKLSFSCMRENEFRDKLNELNRDTGVLTGLESHICVQQTALDMLDAGFSVHVVKDAVSSRKNIDLDTSIEKMKISDVIVTTTETVMYEWMKTANDEKFKDFLQIVKTD